jgi:hypothetical protein
MTDKRCVLRPWNQRTSGSLDELKRFFPTGLV